MSDDKTKMPAYRKRANVFSFWSTKFGLSKEQLEIAAHKLGPTAEDVARELRM